MNKENPSWLTALDKQIQGSKGSTKRQLISLRQSQLEKYRSPVSNEKRKLSDAIELLWDVHTSLGSTKSGMNVGQAILTLEGINAALK